MPTFEERVQDLPAEIYNHIYDLTFVPPHGHNYINVSYRPPAILQVSRATRRMVAQQYYGKGVIFHVPQSLIQKWLTIVEAIARKNFRIRCGIRMRQKSFKAKHMSVGQLIFAFYEESSYAGGPPRSPVTEVDAIRCMKFRVVFGQPKKEVWIGVPDLDEEGTANPFASGERVSEVCERRFGS